MQRLLRRYLDGPEIVHSPSLEDALAKLTQDPARALVVNAASVDATLRALGDGYAIPEGIPVLVCSIPGTEETASALGAAEYLLKPVATEDLMSALDRLHLEGGTLLLVDDEPDALRLFRRMLASCGRSYRTLLASDGQEALTILERERPDAILLDLVMPNLDGFDLLARLNQDASLRDIPAVIMSARDVMGQPIVSHAFAATQSSGLSVPQLLACIGQVSEILSPMDSSVPRGLQGRPPA
jgi:CheY-like chemotaxis protein